MNKLFGASILVLGMAVSSAYANDVDVIADNEVNLASKSDSLNDAKGDGAANAAGEESIAIEDSLNKSLDIDVKKADIDTDITTKDSFNSDLSKNPDDSLNNASGEDSANASGDDSVAINDSLNKDVDVDVKKVDAKTELSTDDALNTATGDASANASGDDSEAHLYSDNKTELSTKDSFNKDTDLKTEISNKDSFNTAKLEFSSSKDSHDIDKSNKDSFNNKDSHDIDKSTKDSHDIDKSNKDSFNTDDSTKDSHDVSTKDSFNKETTTKDSFNQETTNKDSFNKEVTNKDSFNDESKHLTVGDVTLTFENNAAIASAELKSVSIGNKVESDAAFGSKSRVESTAVVGDGSVSGWAGLNQMNVTSGNNNSSQMSQQVTANIRNLEVH